jgi:hypothetical protein
MMNKHLNEWDDEPDGTISLALQRSRPITPAIEQVPRARALKALAVIIEGLNKCVLKMSRLQIIKVDGKIISVTILFD